jgi:hypothetical protein
VRRPVFGFWGSEKFPGIYALINSQAFLCYRLSRDIRENSGQIRIFLVFTSYYFDDEERLAEEAVTGEPVSTPKFPGNREKYREFHEFRGSFLIPG